jgi:hypothetical protein
MSTVDAIGPALGEQIGRMAAVTPTQWTRLVTNQEHEYDPAKPSTLFHPSGNSSSEVEKALQSISSACPGAIVHAMDHRSLDNFNTFTGRHGEAPSLAVVQTHTNFVVMRSFLPERTLNRRLHAGALLDAVKRLSTPNEWKNTLHHLPSMKRAAAMTPNLSTRPLERTLCVSALKN